ncbi:hypothetical protein Pfo_018277 [Paulownia fortunei]|nr:hypothetical protein Pfo_018277 [Paulownia fortunei]
MNFLLQSPLLECAYRPGIYNLVVLLIGGISIAMPTVLFVTMGNTLFIPAGMDADTVILMAARASQLEIKDAVDVAIVGMLDDLKEILNLAYNRSGIEHKLHSVIDKFAEHGL